MHSLKMTLVVLLTASSLQAAMEQARVVTVTSADTFRARLRGGPTESEPRDVEVRLAGIDAPDLAAPGRAADCKAEEALALSRRLLEGQWVSMEPDPALPQEDGQGRLLRYVYVLPGPVDVGAELLELGYAHIHESTRFRELNGYWRLERAARDMAVGIWDDTCVGREPDKPERRLPAKLSEDAAQKIEELEARTGSGLPDDGSPVEDPCCILCVDGQARGDTCIPDDRECTDPPGCACDAEEL